jgi:hypothetical protein
MCEGCKSGEQKGVIKGLGCCFGQSGAAKINGTSIPEHIVTLFYAMPTSYY